VSRNHHHITTSCFRSLVLALALALTTIPHVIAQQQDNRQSPFDGLSFSGQWYMAYEVERSPDENFSEFKLKRGYVSVHKRFTERLSARITQDITVDQEGDGRGDIELRLKYGYMKYQLDQIAFLSQPFMEFGLVHRPWLDFEQKITGLRVQGTMFLERYWILRSADYGVMFGSLLGGQMDAEYRKNVSSAYPGRYGSIAFGLFNGGGYEAIEENENKLFEGRLTLRPLPAVLPGMQASCLVGHGKGNTTASPDLRYLAVFLSMEHSRFLATAQYYTGKGDVFGTAIDSEGKALDQRGFSLLGKVVTPISNLALFGRIDRFDSDTAVDDAEYHRYIAGLSVPIHQKSKIIIDYDHLESDLLSGIERTWEIAVEFNY